jgi:hypothetical protein
MHDDVSYYWHQAERARRFAMEPTDRETKERLRQLAQEYVDIAEDLERGADEIRHPELRQQRRW